MFDVFVCEADGKDALRERRERYLIAMLERFVFDSVLDGKPGSPTAGAMGCSCGLRRENRQRRAVHFNLADDPS